MAILFLAFFLLFSGGEQVFAQTKTADLAGSWYPRDEKELRAALDGYFDAAGQPDAKGRLLGVFSPHAGIVYSGPVAASAYKLLKAQDITTIILLGFSHRKHFDGIGIYDKGRFSTPLGDIKVDEGLASLIMEKSPRLALRPELFQDENSIELQLPFIKYALPDARMVPLVFGSSNYDDAVILAGILSDILAGRADAAIVASTDMSHFRPYKEASAIDETTIGLMKNLDYDSIYKQGITPAQPCCGYMPVSCLLMAAKSAGADGFEALKYATSKDATGDSASVVGYLSAAIYKKGRIGEEPKEANMLNEAQRKRLLEIARDSITSYLREGKRRLYSEPDFALNKPLAAFVTLHKNGGLRGCIGNMRASGPLYKTVAEMAVEAAVGDPRFPAVSLPEMAGIDIEISVLSEMKRVNDASGIKIPGHGVMVKKGLRSGVYLPQVAVETGWGREEFLTSLCAHKAGLAPGAWKDPSVELYVFTAEVFGEKR